MMTMVIFIVASITLITIIRVIMSFQEPWGSFWGDPHTKASSRLGFMFGPPITIYGDYPTGLVGAM